VNSLDKQIDVDTRSKSHGYGDICVPLSLVNMGCKQWK